MKTQIFGVLLLIGATAAVQAADVDPTRQIQNSVYYPHAGEFRVLGEFQGSLSDTGHSVDETGLNTPDRSVNYDQVSATLAAGFFNGFRAAISETGSFHSQTLITNKLNGVQSMNGSKGLSEPTLTISQRLHDSTDEGFYLDSQLSANPHFGRALNAGNNQEGNNLSGGWLATAGLTGTYRFYFDESGKRFANEFYVRPTLTRSFGQSYSGSTAGSSSFVTSYWTSSIDVANRFHLNDQWYFEPSVGLHLPYTFYSSSQLSGAADAYNQIYFNAEPTLTVGFSPTDCVLINAIVSYEYSKSNYNPAPGNGSSQLTRTAQTYAALQAEYAF